VIQESRGFVSPAPCTLEGRLFGWVIYRQSKLRQMNKDTFKYLNVLLSLPARLSSLPCRWKICVWMIKKKRYVASLTAID